MLCGSMANPMALNYVNDTIPGDNPSVAYATVYPLCMFLRVIIAQVLLMFLLNWEIIVNSKIVNRMTAQSNITPESIVSDLRYLQLLSRSFPTIADASTEIINLEAILNLPKGTGSCRWLPAQLF